MPLTKLLSLFLCFCLILEQPVFAQAIDLSHYFVHNSNQNIPQGDKFRPLHLRYISYDNQANDFKILLDKGDFFNQKTEKTLELEQATKELMKYFFIGLSLPNEKFWVNLRPDSPDNILDPELEKTDIGRIFLEADLQLKKDTSGMTSPQTKEGREYWDKLYKKAGELFGNENITIPTITRPWIVPNEIIIREAPDNAYIYKATLKVMLEEDYLNSRGGSRTAPTYQQYAFSDPRLKELNEYSTQLIKETIIPKLTYAVNTAKRYSPLRQVYYSLILAQWFKQKYGSVRSASIPVTSVPVNSYIDLIDSGNLSNLTSKEPYDKQAYFQQYQKSFKDGEYNLQEPVYTPMGQSIRRYTSGGMQMDCSLVIESIPAKGELVFASSAVEGYGFKEGKVSKLKGDLVEKGLHLPSKLRGSLIDAGKHENSKTRQIQLNMEEIGQINNILISGKGLDAVLRYGWGKTREVLTQINYAGIAKKQLEDVVKLEKSGLRKVVLPAGTSDKIDREVNEIYEKYKKHYQGRADAKVDFLVNWGKLRMVGKQYIVQSDTRNVRLEIAVSAANFPKLYDVVCQAFIDKDIAEYVTVGYYMGELGKSEGANLHKSFIIYIPYRDDYDKLLTGVCESLSAVKQRNPEIFQLSPEERIYIKRVNTALFKIPLDENAWCYEVHVLGDMMQAYEGVAIKNGVKLFKGKLPTIEYRGLTLEGPYVIATMSYMPAKDWMNIFLNTLSLSEKPIITEFHERHGYMPALISRPSVSSAVNDAAIPGEQSESMHFDVNGFPLALNGQPSMLFKGMLNICGGNKQKALNEYAYIRGILDNPINGEFKDSKVRDKNGELFIVIHEAPVNIYRYDKSKIGTTNDSGYYGKGFYFSSRNGLGAYVKTGNMILHFQVLNIRNPFYFKDGNKYMKIYRSLLNKADSKEKAIAIAGKYAEETLARERNSLDDLKNGIIRKHRDIPEGVDFEQYWNEEIKKNIKIVENEINEYELLLQNLNNLYDQLQVFDGVITGNDEKGFQESYEELLVYQSEQIYIIGRMPWQDEDSFNKNYFEGGSASINNKSDISGLADSSLIPATDNQPGGIAFNALPIQTESVSSSALGALSGARAFRGDLDAEWGRIQDVFNAGIRPSIQRLSEYTAAAVASPLAEDKIDQVRVMLADILRRDEENEKLTPTEESCKQLLRALENETIPT